MSDARYAAEGRHRYTRCYLSQRVSPSHDRMLFDHGAELELSPEGGASPPFWQSGSGLRRFGCVLPTRSK